MTETIEKWVHTPEGEIKQDPKDLKDRLKQFTVRFNNDTNIVQQHDVGITAAPTDAWQGTPAYHQGAGEFTQHYGHDMTPRTPEDQERLREYQEALREAIRANPVPIGPDPDPTMVPEVHEGNVHEFALVDEELPEIIDGDEEWLLDE